LPALLSGRLFSQGTWRSFHCIPVRRALCCHLVILSCSFIEL
jgi:hypothetical protein